ncbi:MAG TPA: RluA family pseudouridine synthase [Actinomycetota bacterium]|nr:RluA family pseudouridine synthase [Actinomycetota bacterium]
MTPDIYVAAAGRLDVVVAALSGKPRADVQRAITAGRITVDGHTRAKSFRLLGGERLLVDLPGEEPLVADDEGVPIRYRDEHLAVVVKPAGVVTHPTAGRRDGTLVNHLLGMGVALAPAGGALRPGIVHRLDVGTSGLMIVASTDAAFEGLAAQFKRHDIERRYLALVRGAPDHDRFTVEAPLGRRGARVVVDHVEGREASTTFDVRERLARTSLLEAAPATGRTHQIRVHLQAIGHPIVGDRDYGGGGDEARRIGIGRPFLHSWRLRFIHPVTGDEIVCEEPLPADLAEALVRARNDLQS